MAASKDLTPKSDVPNGTDGRSGNSVHVNVDNVHFHANDIRELTKLAEVNPKLANKLVDQKERQSVREESSFRLGLGAALALVSILILGVVYVVTHAGVGALALTIGVILATALLLRVIITGEWSETNWVGRLVNSAIKAAGGKVADETKGDNDD
jgi:hypothetical protein